MARFIVRRLFAMVSVMIIVSVLTFLMLVKIPGGDPGQRLAGRTATQAEVQQIEEKYGFNKPIFTQYINKMKNIFTGQAYSYTQGFNVLDEIKQGLPATLSLAIGAGIFWLLASIAVASAADSLWRRVPYRSACRIESEIVPRTTRHRFTRIAGIGPK